MPLYVYEVWDGGRRLASEMELDDALLFVEAYFEKYYEEQMEITIRRKDSK